MKIDPYDKLQAIRRLPSYRKNIEERAPLFPFSTIAIFEQPKDEFYSPLPLASSNILPFPDGRPIYAPYDWDGKTQFDENELLVLQVDLTCPNKILLQEFVRILKLQVRNSKSRDKKTTVDIWKVWDMRHKEGKNLLQITRELFGITERPADDKIAASRYKQVKRAYEKAKNIIKEVSLSNK